ncbi:MAG: DUF1385 domain-containing protein [Eubacteriales bacterium]
MKKKQSTCPVNERLNRVGGEAVLDGIMMRAGKNCSTAVRLPSGAVKVIPREFSLPKEKHKWMGWPFLRGIFNFIASMKLSFAVLTDSAEAAAGEELSDGKADSWMKKHLGFSLMDLVSGISLVLGVGLALLLFLYLPNLASQGLEHLVGHDLGVWKAVTSGVIKVFIFILYIFLVSLLPDIRRTFQYHGAEHKTIACFESHMELTPENAKKCSRFHPRCGTSFLFVMILLGILLSLGIRIVLEWGFGIDFAILTGSKALESLIYTGIGLLLLPLVMGIGYEFLMYAGKHCDRPLVKFFSAPGLWMQRLTTKEPSLEQLEVAIIATKHALPDLFPDFDRAAYEAKDGYAETAEKDAAPAAESAPDGAVDGEIDGTVDDAVADQTDSSRDSASDGAEPTESGATPSDAAANEKA